MKTLNKTKRSTLGGQRRRRLASARAPFLSRNGSRRGRIGAKRRATSAGETERIRLDARYWVAVKKFDEASRAFRRQNYEKAKELFEKLAKSEVSEVAERARMRHRLCEQRLHHLAPRPKTAEDYYTLGIGALNARTPQEAVEHLTRADKLTPNQEHVLYALAAAHARAGSLDKALEHLQAAINLRPANRVQARHDEDLRALASDARFQRLLEPRETY